MSRFFLFRPSIYRIPNEKECEQNDDDVDGFMTFYQFQKSSYLIFIAPQNNLDFVSDSFKNSPIPTHLML